MSTPFVLPEDWDATDAPYVSPSSSEPVVNPVMRIRRLSEMKTPPPTRWCAKGWIPYSEITVLVGEEGLGKSLAWVRWVARITTGQGDPSINMPPRKPRDVVVIITEDSPGEVQARLEAAGADTSRIHFFSSEADGTGNPVFGNSFNSGDMATLDAYLEAGELDVALVVIDAWVDTVAGNLTLKDSQQARQAMHPLKVLAQKHAIGVILVTHTNRMSTSNTRDLMGSTAVLRQKARMVLFAARSPEDKDNGGRHIWIGPDKSNVTGIANAVKYNLDIQQARLSTEDDPGTTARLDGPQDTLKTIRNLLGEWREQEEAAARKPTKAEGVQEAVRAYMADTDGSTASADLKAHLKAEGYGKTLIEDTLKEMGESKRDQFGGAYTFHLHASYLEPISQEPRTHEKHRNHDATKALMLPKNSMLPSAETYSPELGSMARLTGKCSCGGEMTEYMKTNYGTCFTCAEGESA